MLGNAQIAAPIPNTLRLGHVPNPATPRTVPLLALVLGVIWMAHDMDATPKGDVDTRLAQALLTPAQWLEPIVQSPRRGRESAFDPGVTLNKVHFVDARHGWAVGGGGTILATRNGGKT